MIESSWLQEKTQHPDAMTKIQELEAPKAKSDNELDAKFDHPTFTSHLNNIEVAEHGTAIFECKVEPFKDPTLKIGNKY